MAQRKVFIKGIGEAYLSKRRGNRNLRLSVSSGGRIRVSMPLWTPYYSGILFAQKNKLWIEERLQTAKQLQLSDGDRVGKQHKISYRFNPQPGEPIRTRVSDGVISITSSLPIHHPDVQKKLASACERALKVEATEYLPVRLKKLADEYGYKYGSVKIKKLSSRWGSCTDKGDIALNCFLMQLPGELIDYVLLHELVHTVHKHHAADFWTELTQKLPAAKQLRKNLRNYQPRLSVIDKHQQIL